MKLGIRMLLALAVLLVAQYAQAQTTVTCASEISQRNYCAADTRGGVTMVRQLSIVSCEQGRSWGYDERGIWVDHGCRAEFRVQAEQYNRGSGGDNITCSSEHNRRNYCTADTRGGVTLVRKLSNAPCDRGRTWGYDAQGIWVDRGCRAEFQVSPYSGSGPWWWNSGNRRPTNQPRSGACFYRDANFSGDYFCMTRGQSYANLPRGWEDQISSIRVAGRATVTIYVDNNFNGASASTRSDVANLHDARLGRREKWNDRISSLRVD